MAREINLVPDIKNDMIKALKLRNLVFFLSIIVAAASIGVTLVAGLTAGGQQIALNNKKAAIDELSTKLNSYSDLTDFLTIKDQLADIDNLTDNKTVLSRTFNILGAILPTNGDTITISELTVDLSEESPTYAFDAQANAGQAPYIDYNVLDAFKKSMAYVRYDYGNYVDKDGNTIPAYCMIESGNDGASFIDPTQGRYAYWTIKAEGCDTTVEPDTESDDESDTESNEESDTTDTNNTNTNNNTNNIDSSVYNGYNLENYNGQQVVKVWRTPLFADWYKEEAPDSGAYMSLDGQISGVPHFESSCITYTGHTDSNYSIGPDEAVVTKAGDITWVSKNDSCLLVPEGEEGITISESSNGRGSDNELVLRFSARIVFAPEAYAFNNTHMLALAPTSRRNVTDSYVQIQSMFGERAADCEEGDTACANANSANNANNSGSGSSNNNNTNGGN